MTYFMWPPRPSSQNKTYQKHVSKTKKTCLTYTGGPREGRAGHLGRGGPSVGGQDVLQLPGDHRDDQDVVVIVVVVGVVVLHNDHQWVVKMY